MLYTILFFSPSLRPIFDRVEEKKLLQKHTHLIYYVDTYMGIFKRKMTWISCQAPKLIRLFTQRPVTAGMWREQGTWAEDSKLWESDQEIHGEKLMEDKGYLSRAICTGPF